jgi:hypothetical protein
MTLYDEQMESWLEFAYTEYTQNRSNYYQIQAQLKPGNAMNGRSKARSFNTWATKTDHYSFNNYLCYNNWRTVHKGKWVRYHLLYTDAVLAMHTFFDYMEEL